MPLTNVGHKAMTIPSGGSTSNAIVDFDDAWGLAIYSPAALTNTCTVEVEPSSSGTNFVVLQSGGTDVTLPAGKATIFSPSPWKQMRVTSGGAEGADRVFAVTRQILI